MGKGLFAWYRPVFKTNEDVYVHMIGLDAVVFLRFARMCRNMFVVLSIVGCAVIIPINVTKTIKFQEESHFASATAIVLMTPRALFGEIFWAFVAIAYLFNIIVCSFLWWTYRAVHRLRRKYLEGAEYQSSLHSRTLMITDINRNFRTDQGLVEITDSLRTTPEVPRASIGRNVKDIPDLIEEHEEAVIKLETVLAKYLKNPNQLPATRPLCTPNKKDPEFKDSKQQVDAIDYLTARIQRLEAQIKEVRETVDKRDAMPYGFASYETIESAHSVAFAARNKHPKGTTVLLAPRPKDIIWKNLLLDSKTRRWRRFINRLWITLLTVLYFIPNALIAIFLSKLTNLGLVWKTFNDELTKNPKFWAVVQGLLAPALTSLFYYFLPMIFRRLSMKAGDLTKTSRERHVTGQLYNFFVFNNLFVFSLFSAMFGMVSLIVKLAREEHLPFMVIIRDIAFFDKTMQTLCDVSPFWVTWLVQRNLGAVIDLSQAANLAWGSFSRKFLNPTPRQLIMRTAPPPFDYASYYNYFLFYSTVALCFAPLQPITLVVVAFYFSIDSWMKKYLLMYVFCTKNESGGLYWRVLFNRMLVGLMLSNCIIALLCAARGYGSKYTMLGALAPLPILLLAFKFYCKSAFDDTIKYYSKGEIAKGGEAAMPIDKEARKRDRVAVRFGYVVLYIRFDAYANTSPVTQLSTRS
jgi:Ca2+/Na+ antiporter